MHPVVDGITFVIEEDIELTKTAGGNAFVISTVLIMQLAENGEIVRLRDYTDNLTIAQGLGRLPRLAG